MKKGKIIINALAFAIAIGSAFAFKAKTAGVGDLWYINSENNCVLSPCTKIDQGPQNRCDVGQLYVLPGCAEEWPFPDAWVADE